jgi:hypothetical protein
MGAAGDLEQLRRCRLHPLGELRAKDGDPAGQRGDVVGQGGGELGFEQVTGPGGECPDPVQVAGGVQGTAGDVQAGPMLCRCQRSRLIAWGGREIAGTAETTAKRLRDIATVLAAGAVPVVALDAAQLETVLDARPRPDHRLTAPVRALAPGRPLSTRVRRHDLGVQRHRRSPSWSGSRFQP